MFRFRTEQYLFDVNDSFPKRNRHGERISPDERALNNFMQSICTIVKSLIQFNPIQGHPGSCNREIPAILRQNLLLILKMY